MNTKLTSNHLNRRAVVYIRQSTVDQVKNNLESQRRQYALKEKAHEMGWVNVEIIDDDLGKSGATSHNRTGFMRLVGQVSLKEIGAVFAVEASRLARNNKDWTQLVDICGLTNTLIIDHDGVYDPHILNDRLLLGLKGTMSEFELGMIRQRSVEALRQMIKRGDLWTTVPAGYVRTKKYGIEKVPDIRIQQAIMFVFAKFAEVLSVRQVLLWFRQEQLQLPVLEYDVEGAHVVWKLPVYKTILAMLQNPIYAGIYAYGRSKTVTTVVDGQAIKTHGIRVPREEWQVFIPNHHEGYIPLAVYEQNQRIIRENAAMKGALTRGPARKGKSLLAGLLRCRRCGRKLHVTYCGKDSKVVRYSCRGAKNNHGTGSCISFGGLAVDRAVEKEILSVLETGAIKRALERQQEQKDQQQYHLQALEHAAVQAEYESERIFRQYSQVEPENRLVAKELERRWNEALQKATLARQTYEGFKVNQKSKDYSYLLNLADDFPRVWHNPMADMSLKKQMPEL
jgi:DNA invertase Pin-like site-specific DNA recombinase